MHGPSSLMPFLVFSFLFDSVSLCISSSMFKSFFQFFFLFLPTQGLNLYLLCHLHCRQILYLLNHQGSPFSHISPQIK